MRGNQQTWPLKAEMKAMIQMCDRVIRLYQENKRVTETEKQKQNLEYENPCLLMSCLHCSNDRLYVQLGFFGGLNLLRRKLSSISWIIQGVFIIDVEMLLNIKFKLIWGYPQRPKINSCKVFIAALLNHWICRRYITVVTTVNSYSKAVF